MNLKLTQLIEEYPSNFNFDEMLKINSYKGRIDYCKSRLKQIGRGSSRVAFQVDEKIVLKVALNKKGISQNEVEINSYDNYYSNILAEVFEYSEDGIFLEMELARTPKPTDFKRILGVDVKYFVGHLRNEYLLNNGRKALFSIPKQQVDIINELEEFNDILSFCSDYNINPSDFSRLGQWGIVQRSDGEHLVLIDYGFDENVEKLYR
jgi:hypothetical protein